MADKELAYEKATQRAQALCAKQERCSFDIYKKLQQWNVAGSDIDKILKKLISDGYINDERFALIFARDKHKFNKWGHLKIASALRFKHIPEIIIQKSIKEISSIDEETVLLDLFKKKAKTIKAKSMYDLKAKLVRFGVSRGFEYNIILKIVDKTIEMNLN